MKHTRTFHPAGLGALLLCLVIFISGVSAHAESAKYCFTKGYQEFHALKKTRTKKKYRSNWLKVEKWFSRALKADPDGSFAPKSLYYLGRVHEELGVQSGRKSDFNRAEDYFGRVVARFPRHGWADDCLYRRAVIRYKRLNDRKGARQDLAKIITQYPRADMYSRSRTLLSQLGGYKSAVAAAKASQKPRQKPTPKKTTYRAPDPSGQAHLDQVRFKSSDDYTRVVLELDGRSKYRYQLLAPSPKHNRPHRLYIDLENSRLGHDVPASTTVADGLLKQIRAGQFDKSTTRVVLDFHALREYKVFPLDNPFRIVVDVYSNGDETPVPAQARTGITPKKDYRPPKGSKRMAGDLLEQLGLTVRTIMLDAGHGGKDPGAVANGLREKDVNLKFVKLLGRMLEEKGFHVLYTRSTDTFIPLEQRTALANAKKADMFLSVHCNANRNKRVHGLETYSLNLAKTNAAVRIAARENAVDPRSISDLQFILTDLMVNSKIKESQDLASDVQKQTVSYVRRKWQVKNMGTREAPFYVLMGARMPSVLVELGYLTNRTEAKRLRSDKYLTYLARGIVQGVIAYKGKIERYAMK
ncbi:N-acetylmuramoyl-L-alanine amidase [Pseudodesulfovibrio tunisiensis]|uniref:N-acetylmuramoyl-L-alanine amidase n=1 Tax=Pseudodesulfovibrio tunisiensis TaxID=463192 RepID=UPI001FB23E0E|nr:N-acetylmuramoyl-L-alanine amidase [Pseudodesulfovibrio tunisiensis]